MIPKLMFASFFSLAALTAFYVYSPSLSSRYLIDFAPALICSGLVVLRFARNWRGIRGMLPAVLIILLVLGTRKDGLVRAIYYSARDSAVPASQRPRLRDPVDSARARALLLPADYRCPYTPAAVFQHGWNKSSCAVNIMSHVLMKSGACLSVRTSGPPGCRALAVRAGNSELQLESSTRHGNERLEVFCARRPPFNRADRAARSLISIRWAPPNKRAAEDPSCKLIELRSLEMPPERL